MPSARPWIKGATDPALLRIVEANDGMGLPAIRRDILKEDVLLLLSV